MWSLAIDVAWSVYESLVNGQTDEDAVCVLWTRLSRENHLASGSSDLHHHPPSCIAGKGRRGTAPR